MLLKFFINGNLTIYRMILLAAAPGEILPNYPEPTNVFNISKYSCTFVDNKKVFFYIFLFIAYL